MVSPVRFRPSAPSPFRLRVDASPEFRLYSAPLSQGGLKKAAKERRTNGQEPADHVVTTRAGSWRASYIVSSSSRSRPQRSPREMAGEPEAVPGHHAEHGPLLSRNDEAPAGAGGGGDPR